MKRLPLVWKIVIGLVLGIAVGHLLNTFPAHKSYLVAEVLKPAGDIFLKLMKMIVVPMVFSCMIVGIVGDGDNKSFGRLGVKSMLYFFCITSAAAALGLVGGNLFHPGAGVNIGAGQPNPASAKVGDMTSTGAMSILSGIVPENIFQALADGKLLPVIFFAVLFGLALNKLPADKRAPLLTVFKSVAETMFLVTGSVMAYAPIGVFAMLSVTVATFGFPALLPLAKLIGVVYLCIAVFAIVVLGLVARFVGENIFHIIRYFRAELVLAFSTASSSAVMPQLIKRLETYGVAPRVVSFVVPVGYAFNLDGASIFLGVAALFVAQLYGIDLTLGQQAVLLVTMVLTSKGAAGVPGFALVILSATVASAGLPLEGVALIAGIFRIIDMATTTLNVLGNTVAPIVIAKWDAGRPSVDGAP